MDEEIQDMGRRDDTSEGVPGDQELRVSGADVPDPGAARVQKSYVGSGSLGSKSVRVVEPGSSRPLSKRLDLANHSPDGFEWGYRGSGPAQLALALVADATGDDEIALTTYQSYKNSVVALLDRDDDFTLTSDEVLAEVNRLRRVMGWSWKPGDIEVHDTNG